MRFVLRKDLPEIKTNAVAFINGLEDDCEWEIQIKKYQRSRSAAQNNTLFGVVYPPIMLFMGLKGERDKLELHEYFCGEYFGWETTQILGRTIQRPKRTTTTDQEGKKAVLTKLEFSQFIDWIVQRAAEHGCVVTMPSEAHGW